MCSELELPYVLMPFPFAQASGGLRSFSDPINASALPVLHLFFVHELLPLATKQEKQGQRNQE